MLLDGVQGEGELSAGAVVSLECKETLEWWCQLDGGAALGMSTVCQGQSLSNMSRSESE